MKKLMFALCLLAFLGLGQRVFCQDEQMKYSKVKIMLDSRDDLKKIARLGIPLEEGEMKKDAYFITDLSEREIVLVKGSGLKYEILIDDVSAYYVDRNKQSLEKDMQDIVDLDNCFNFSAYKTPANFRLGSMSGYFTYNELLDELDNMRSKFPELISKRTQISSIVTSENRPVFYVKISNNPDVERNVPKVLYTALTHAREPVGMQQLIFYMYFLLENYNTIPEVKYLLDNAELFFMPCVNIDGYVYNQTIKPQGGGMWRKNRRYFSKNTFGVDLNRNFGYMWGIDDEGSSPDTSSDTYRGTSPFSEKETQAVKWICDNFKISLCLNYHTYSNLLINPWNYNNKPTPDSAAYSVLGSVLCEQYNLNNGGAIETVGYISNGDAGDWMYGEQKTKTKIFSFTPELGSPADGFWAMTDRIIPICRENLNMNLNLVRLALKYARAGDAMPSVFQNKSGFIKFRIQNLGLDTPATFSVSVTPLGQVFNSTGNTKIFNTMKLIEIRTDSVFYELNAGIAEGQELKYVISISNGLFTYSDTISKFYGKPVVLLNDLCSNLNKWTTKSAWNSTSKIYHSAPASITDSPNGNYSDFARTYIYLKNEADLTNAVYAEMSFWARWNTEKGYDFAQVMISIDKGISWSPACGQISKSGNNAQSYGKPLYDGIQNTWIQEKINLSSFLGKKILVRFSLTSDGRSDYDGFYFDDFNIMAVYAEPTFINVLSESSVPEISGPIPNPADNFILINYSIPRSVAIARLVIFNSIGQMIMESGSISGRGMLEINTESLKPGIYFCLLKSEKQTSAVKKLVKLL